MRTFPVSHNKSTAQILQGSRRPQREHDSCIIWAGLEARASKNSGGNLGSQRLVKRRAGSSILNPGDNGSKVSRRPIEGLSFRDGGTTVHGKHCRAKLDEGAHNVAKGFAEDGCRPRQLIKGGDQQTAKLGINAGVESNHGLLVGVDNVLQNS